MSLMEINQIAAGSENMADTSLCQTTHQIEQTEFQTPCRFIKIGTPDVPAGLLRLNFAGQQRQPERRVELTMEEEVMCAILGAGNNRIGQRFFVRINTNIQTSEFSKC
ncbi:hypothetical protein SRABI106_02727 [Rahnella aquatilis]|nr:hypothetical protein SRABI106_02727 [Rahnella aquatilis]